MHGTGGGDPVVFLILLVTVLFAAFPGSFFRFTL